METYFHWKVHISYATNHMATFDSEKLGCFMILRYFLCEGGGMGLIARLKFICKFSIVYLFFPVDWVEPPWRCWSKKKKKNDAATVNSLSHVLFVGLWLWTAAINNTYTTVGSQRLPPPPPARNCLFYGRHISGYFTSNQARKTFTAWQPSLKKDSVNKQDWMSEDAI